jgi:hypothetical protein
MPDSEADANSSAEVGVEPTATVIPPMDPLPPPTTTKPKYPPPPDPLPPPTTTKPKYPPPPDPLPSPHTKKP